MVFGKHPGVNAGGCFWLEAASLRALINLGSGLYPLGG